MKRRRIVLAYSGGIRASCARFRWLAERHRRRGRRAHARRRPGPTSSSECARARWPAAPCARTWSTRATSSRATCVLPALQAGAPTTPRADRRAGAAAHRAEARRDCARSKAPTPSRMARATGVRRGDSRDRSGAAIIAPARDWTMATPIAPTPCTSTAGHIDAARTADRRRTCGQPVLTRRSATC